MKFCYCDESGMGEEPVATMIGLVVDSTRMRYTKADWRGLLAELTEATGRPVTEVHMRDLYNGRGPYRHLFGGDGNARAWLIGQICRWIGDRKHHIVYSAIDKEAYREAWALQRIPDELGTIWRFMGFHMMLAVQRRFGVERNLKGNTVFIFDNEEREQMRFADLVKRPPDWSDGYYDNQRTDVPLDQVIDVPYFGASDDLPLIQVADAAAFILRRYAEVAGGYSDERYRGELERLTEWVGLLTARSIGRSHVYPRRRNEAQEMFYSLAPASIRDL
ncbi:MAG: DUF3800 domain-containing protein [Dehalococcoidia bacterium]